MENIKFTSKQIAAWKRIAMNVNADVVRREKLIAKCNELQKEIDQLNRIIDLNEAPVKEATGGYTTDVLFTKVVTETGKVDKDGRPLKMTKYELRYPDTILPVQEEISYTNEPNCAVPVDDITEIS